MSSRSTFDVESMLQAAGIERPSREQRERMRRALTLYAAALYPKLAASHKKWRNRATRLRDLHAPHMSWGRAETDDDPTSA